MSINEIHLPSNQHHYGLVNWMSLGILGNITSKHGGVLLYGPTNCIVGPCNKHHECASAMRLSLLLDRCMVEIQLSEYGEGVDSCSHMYLTIKNSIHKACLERR